MPTVFPQAAQFGHGKHAMVNMDKMNNNHGVFTLCDQCYVGLMTKQPRIEMIIPIECRNARLE